jgi:hypothetical protein
LKDQLLILRWGHGGPTKIIVVLFILWITVIFAITHPVYWSCPSLPCTQVHVIKIKLIGVDLLAVRKLLETGIN